MVMFKQVKNGNKHLCCPDADCGAVWSYASVHWDEAHALLERPEDFPVMLDGSSVAKLNVVGKIFVRVETTSPPPSCMYRLLLYYVHERNSKKDLKRGCTSEFDNGISSKSGGVNAKKIGAPRRTGGGVRISQKPKKNRHNGDITTRGALQIESRLGSWIADRTRRGQ